VFFSKAEYLLLYAWRHPCYTSVYILLFIEFEVNKKIKQGM